MKYNFSNLLNEIVKDYEDFEILDDGRSDYLYLKYGEKSWKFYPKTLGYDDFMLTKDLDDIKVEQYRMALFKQLGILPKLKPEQPKQEQKTQIKQSNQTTINTNLQFSIKSLLQEVFKGNNKFKVLTNSTANNCARVQNLTTNKIINFKPSDLGFNKINESKNFTKNEITKLKQKILKVIEPEPSVTQKEYKFEIKNLTITGDLGMNEIIKARNTETKLNSIYKTISGVTEIAISKYCKNWKFKKQIMLGMSFKSNLDPSNHSYIFKVIEDCLVNAKIIEDDSEKFIKAIWIEKHTDGDAAVIVKIKEI